MSRNNQERTGAHATTEAPPEVLKRLEFVAPTELVDLPSKGLYPEGHPLSGQDSIEIRFMTAKDEDILTSQSLLKKGVAIERFLQNVILNKSIRTEDMWVCDRNAVLIAARRSGYGAEYETKINCPHCGEVNHLTFDLNNPEIVEPNLTDIVFDGGQYFVTAPLTNFRVGLRMMNGRDEAFMAKLLTDKKRKEENNVTEQLRRIITSVEGDDSAVTLNYYVDNIPTQDSRFLRAAYNALSPSIRIVNDLKCHSCGYEQEMEVPFGADFFWPDR